MTIGGIQSNSFAKKRINLNKSSVAKKAGSPTANSLGRRTLYSNFSSSKLVKARSTKVNPSYDFRNIRAGLRRGGSQVYKGASGISNASVASLGNATNIDTNYTVDNSGQSWLQTGQQVAELTMGVLNQLGELGVFGGDKSQSASSKLDTVLSGLGGTGASDNVIANMKSASNSIDLRNSIGVASGELSSLKEQTPKLQELVSKATNENIQKANQAKSTAEANKSEATENNNKAKDNFSEAKGKVKGAKDIVDGKKGQLDQAIEQYETSNKAWANAKKAVVSAQQTLSNAKSTLASTPKQITKTNPDGTTTKVDNPAYKTAQEAVENAQKELDKAQSEEKKAYDALNKADKDKISADQNLKNAEKKYDEAIENQDKCSEQVSVAEEALEESEAKLEEAEEKFKEAEKAYNELKDAQSNLQKHLQKIQNLDSEITSAKKRLEKVEAKEAKEAEKVDKQVEKYKNKNADITSKYDFNDDKLADGETKAYSKYQSNNTKLGAQMTRQAELSENTYITNLVNGRSVDRGTSFTSRTTTYSKGVTPSGKEVYYRGTGSNAIPITAEEYANAEKYKD